MASQTGKALTNLAGEVIRHTGPGSSGVIKHGARRLPPLMSMSDLLRLYKVRAKKHLSQNFLLNPRVCRKFVSLSRLKERQTIVEIGPGPGNLTRYLLERNPRELYVIEKDRRFLPCLEMLADAAQPGQMKIMLGDVMDYSLDNMLPQDLKMEWNGPLNNVHIIGNLPFNITTPLLIRLLRQMYNQTGLFAYGRCRMTLTFQLEFAQRIIAPVLCKERSRLSVMCQNVAHVELVQRIKGESFTPAPEVDVGVVNFIPRIEPVIKGMPFEVIEKFIRTMFHMRRAYVKTPVGKLFPPDIRYLVLDLFKKANISPEDRVLMFDVEEIGRLVQPYWEYCQQIPNLFDYDHQAPKRKRTGIAEDIVVDCEEAEGNSKEEVVATATK